MSGQPSLRRRLLLAGGIGLLLVSLLASALLGELFKRSARDRLDHELQQDLLTLVAQMETTPDGQLQLRQEPNDARFQRVFSGAYWQIANRQGEVLLQSRSLWDETLPAAAAGDATRNLPGPLQQALRAREQEVRLPRATEAYRVTVATDRSALDADVAAFRQRTALALGVLVAVWLAVLASQVQFGLRPLRRLAHQLERVRRGQAQRIDTDGLGSEIVPLGEELNALLEHQQRMVARARTSAEDLAHALKTPLSVLAAETDSAGTDWRTTVREQGTRMQASVDRYLAVGLAADHRQRTGVAPVAQALCGLMARVHGERGVMFGAEGIDETLQFAGARADLEEMLGNLLDNAGKWARQRVSISAASDEGQLRIDVRDDGPGLAAEALAQVTQRGVRLDEREGSSGLGLAIVGDIAASYGGRLVLENAEPGLRATVWLPVG
ncbi:sensor histidine kinase [Stenotrophomonas cyclobalanopsidis]|uniref:sensor histidine kinase n=1 Tax=Stenotrophomonas cyclobalanopsidis TaxID=2771362 RepID=UPI0028ACFBFD|nr:sensor histidine kinase [Stenotrophomonas cyclobalanopsidis]